MEGWKSCRGTLTRRGRPLEVRRTAAALGAAAAATEATTQNGSCTTVARGWHGWGVLTLRRDGSKALVRRRRRQLQAEEGGKKGGEKDGGTLGRSLAGARRTPTKNKGVAAAAAPGGRRIAAPVCPTESIAGYGRYRPSQSSLSKKVEGWQILWWHYAQQAILADVRQRLRRISWSNLGQRLNYRRRYIDLYRRKLELLQNEQIEVIKVETK
ncbi:hypothetical protein ACMD2_06003 [Ananas comosus]|uniref:Uncharacterized protein n=1 Tax=Ananas comosus TaxID=4615 RepID=A0A199VY12_ANACO|nr:hypothetical protein ACMD2_06003 [Ananas comosus]